jgi:hypothetical protein
MADQLEDTIVSAFTRVLSCSVVTYLKVEFLKACCYSNVTPRFIYLLI